MYTLFALLCVVLGLLGFKVGLANTAPMVGSALGMYTNCGEYSGPLDSANSVTISIDCAAMGQTFQHVIIDGSRLVSAELCMDEVEVYARSEYRTQLRSDYYITIAAYWPTVLLM